MTLNVKPSPDEYGSFYTEYVAKVSSPEIIPFLSNQTDELQTILANLTDKTACLIQKPYQWNIKQLMGHLIDGEKVFGYRLHRFACGDLTPLPGFDHEPYVANLDYESVSLQNLVDEFSALRRSNVLFLSRLPEKAASRTGIASDCQFTVRSQAFIIAGHVQHHLEILGKRVNQLMEH